MRRQRNMSQIIARDLSKVEISNIPDREFKVTIIKIFMDLRKEYKTSVRPLTKR